MTDRMDRTDAAETALPDLDDEAAPLAAIDLYGILDTPPK